MSIVDLWLPMLVSSVLIWIVSAFIWTVLPWQRAISKRLWTRRAPFRTQGT